MYLSPFLYLPPVWGWIMEEGMDLWPNETNQRDSLWSWVGWLGCWGPCLLASPPADFVLALQHVVVRGEVGRKAGLVQWRSRMSGSVQVGSLCLGTPYS